MKKKAFVAVSLLLTVLVYCSCERKEIQFGTAPPTDYARIVYIDTIEPILSTVTLDSFKTNSPGGFLFGKYHDPYLGIISTKPFFQVTTPAVLPTIPATAHYDSMALIIYLDNYAYGDTTRAITLQANELSLPIDYSYSTNIYNNSDVPVKPTPLGSRTLKIRPSFDDSVTIRLNDAKGLEFFNKLQSGAVEMSTSTNFLSYFKGVSLSVNANDTAAVYGFKSAAGGAIIRLYYHLTIPFIVNNVVDFGNLQNDLSFNQILTDRTGTPFFSATRGVKEFPAVSTGNYAATQFGAGTLLKATFPTLKSILQTGSIVKLLKAEMIFKPLGQTYSGFLHLPASFFMSQTDASNVIEGPVTDSITVSIVNATPNIDYVYGLNTYYKFDVTSYVNYLINTPGTEKMGLFLMQNDSLPKVDRAIIGNLHSPYKTQLQLTVAIIDR